ncbi:MAG: hypothetical protein HYY28_04330 [Betaproteobacteria bacterium]|nr:hypothetical protein [Betaproteobacteria bacterium]MBI2959518.1 hypothetical protein [Betaproteobacteria bacterium]
MERAAVERERLAAQLAPWRARLGLIDRSATAARSVLAHPEWLAAAAVLILILRPRRALAWARRGLLLWRAWRWTRQAAREILARKPA